MAVVTWDGSSSTDFATAANWDAGSVPTSSDDVIIPNTSSINDCVLDGDRTINSLEIQGNGSFSMNDHDLTIAGENSSGRALDIGNNTVTFVGGTGTLIFTLGSGATLLVGTQHLTASTELRNVQFNGAATFVLSGAMTVNGNLTITTGTLSTSSDNNHALTVTGRTDIGPASGSADQATLTCNASTVSLGSGRTSSYGLIVNQGGTFTGGSGNHTIGSIETKNNSNAKCTLTSGVTTIDSENTSDNYALSIEGNSTFAHGSGTVTITTATDSRIRNSGADLALNNFIINHASAVITLASNGLTCAGDLTITAGEFGTGADKALTVTGDASVTGTLTGNASAISLGSLVINSGGEYKAPSGTTTITGESSGSISGFAWYNVGTFTDNDGTVTIGDGSTSIGTTHIRENRFHHLIINRDASSTHTVWRDTSGSTLTIDGDLTITKGKFFRNTVTDTLTVTGDVSVGATGILGDGSESGANNFGSLTIASGGTYVATSGTTTITTATGAGSSSNRAAFCHASGTFTHNNGLFKTTAGNADVEFTSQSETNNPFYNFEATQYAIAATSPWVVLNNMTIANGFQFNGSGGFAKVLGIMKHTGGTYNASDVSSSTSHFFNHYRLEGGTLDLSNIDITVGSIRNTGGTIS